MTKSSRRLVRLEDLVGRRVRASDGRMVGRIEEVRAEQRGDRHEVTEYHLGTGALFERLAIVGKRFGRGATLLIARWDQLDIHSPEAPTLTCRVDELRHEQR